MNLSTLQHIRFHPDTLTEEQWNALIVFRQASAKENSPDDPIPSAEYIRKAMMTQHDHPLFEPHFHLYFDDTGQVIAGVIHAFHRPGSPEYDEQKHMGFFMPQVASDYRRQGLGRQLLDAFMPVARERNITLIQGETNTAAGRAFAESLNADIAIEGKVSRLYLDTVDWNMIEQWQSDGAARNTQTTIETWTGLPPEADIDVYCKIYTEVLNQQPFDNAEGLVMNYTPERMRKINEQNQQRNITTITKIAREPDGVISGMTDIEYTPDRGHKIFQGLTGVQNSQRGRGLGKWLKADMLRYIRENYPDVEFIETDNAASNDAMLSINVRMGFEVYHHSVMYRLPVTAL